MRWQFYGHEEPRGMYEDLTTFPLQKLYEIQERIEKHLAELRANEPSAKRKNESAHSVWFSQCQGCIDDLKEVRDAICIVKERKAQYDTDQQ